MANFEVNLPLKSNVQCFNQVTVAFDVCALTPSCWKHPSRLLENSFVAVNLALVAARLNTFAGIHFFFEYFADVVTAINESFMSDDVKLF